MMSKTVTKRVNITLPQETLELIDRLAPKGARSRLISQAVHFYVDEMGQENLRRLLREGAVEHAQRDRQLSEDWFTLEEEI